MLQSHTYTVIHEEASEKNEVSVTYPTTQDSEFQIELAFSKELGVSRDFLEFDHAMAVVRIDYSLLVEEELETINY